MSQETMRYATLESDGQLYIHTVEDYSDDDQPQSTYTFVQGYAFSYPIMHVNQASRSQYRQQLIDDFVANGGSETENFKTQEAFDDYIDRIKHQHNKNQLYVVADEFIDLTVGDLVHQLLIKLLTPKGIE